MIRYKLLFLTLIISYSSIGQTKDYFDKDVLQAQRKTVAGVVYGLKINKVDLILQFFEDGIDGLDSKLQQSVLEIDKFQESTILTDIVSYDEGSHIFTCRYSDKKRARFQIDLYLTPDDPNSKITKLIIKKDKELKEEYDSRMNASKIPPPPPAPPKRKKTGHN